MGSGRPLFFSKTPARGGGVTEVVIVVVVAGASAAGAGAGVLEKRREGKEEERVTRSYKEKANSNRPIGPYKAVRYLT